MNQILRRYSYWVQIFCLINCALLYTPLIKFGQLASPVKWDNPDFNTNVKVKIIPFFFLPQLLFLLSISGFWFLFFLFSMWLTLTRTLLSIVFCCSFSFLFGLFPLLSHCIPIFLPKFYCPLLQRFLLSGADLFQLLRDFCWNKQPSRLSRFLFFLFSMWLTLTRSPMSFVSCCSFCFWFGLFATFKAFKVSTCFICSSSSSSPQLQTHPHFIFIFKCSSASIGFYEVICLWW